MQDEQVSELERELDDYISDERVVDRLVVVGVVFVVGFWLVMWFFVEALFVTLVAALLMAAGNTAFWLAAAESNMREEFSEYLESEETLDDVREAYACGDIGDQEMEQRVEELVTGRARGADLDESNTATELVGERR